MTKFKKVYLSETTNEQWNEWALALSDANAHHSAEMLRYYDAFQADGQGGLSFAVWDSSADLIAICPFGVRENTLASQTFKEASAGGIPLAYPALKFGSSNERRRIARDVFILLDEECQRHDVQRIAFVRFPICLRTAQDPRPLFSIEALENGYVGHSRSVLVMDLRRTESALFECFTTEQRKRIRQTTRKGLYVRSFGKNPPESAASDSELTNIFTLFRQAHFKSAGRSTRPELTWQLMQDYLIQGKTTLFAAFVEQTPVSFLYCGEFGDLSLGWSQANVEEFEAIYSPRHMLEWQAMNHYRARGFSFYEIGPRFKMPSLYHVPTPKQITISQTKERYGADPWPEYFFEKFFDLELEESVFQERYKAYKSARITQSQLVTANETSVPQ